MYSPFLPGRSGSCTLTSSLPFTNVAIQRAPRNTSSSTGTTNTTTTAMPPRPKPCQPAAANYPTTTTTNHLLTRAAINAPWTPAFDAQGALIPYLQQTTIANVPVRKGPQSAPSTKTVRFLLLTHSDGGKLIHDNAGFTESQYCLPGSPRYLGLMCQLGEALATNLGINSGGNKHTDPVWDVLVQLPLKYNAYYKTRRSGGGAGLEHMDLYVAGHDYQKFDSVKQFAVHLAWLAVENACGGMGVGVGFRCECKVCREERGKKGVGVESQVERKSRWAEHCRPVVEGVPDWTGP